MKFRNALPPGVQPPLPDCAPAAAAQVTAPPPHDTPPATPAVGLPLALESLRSSGRKKERSPLRFSFRPVEKEPWHEREEQKSEKAAVQLAMLDAQYRPVASRGMVATRYIPEGYWSDDRHSVGSTPSAGAVFTPLSDGSLFVNNEHSVHLFREGLLPDNHSVLAQDHGAKELQDARERLRSQPFGHGAVALRQGRLEHWGRSSSGAWSCSTVRASTRVVSFDTVGNRFVLALADDGTLSLSAPGSAATSRDVAAKSLSSLLGSGSARPVRIRAGNDGAAFVGTSDGLLHEVDLNAAFFGQPVSWQRPGAACVPPARVIAADWDHNGALTVLPNGSLCYSAKATFPEILIVSAPDRTWIISERITLPPTSPQVRMVWDFIDTRAPFGLPALLVQTDHTIIFADKMPDESWASGVFFGGGHHDSISGVFVSPGSRELIVTANEFVKGESRTVCCGCHRLATLFPCFPSWVPGESP